MSRSPSWTYVAITALAAALAVGGAWLPRLRKLPAGYMYGQPVYTAEGRPGLQTGFAWLDWYLIALVLGVVVVAAVSRYTPYRPTGLAAVAGGILVVVAGGLWHSYVGNDNYALGRGAYLLFASGALLVLLDVGSLLVRRGVVGSEISRDAVQG